MGSVIRLSGKVVLLIGNEESVDRFNKILEGEGAKLWTCIIPKDEATTSLDQSAQYMKVVAGFNDTIERYKKVDIVLACLTKENDGSYEQGGDRDLVDIEKELESIKNITYPATYISRVASYRLRVQGLERKEQGGAIPQLIYIVDQPNPIENSASPSDIAASNSVLAIVKSTAPAATIHGYGVSVICASKTHDQTATIIDPIIELSASPLPTFESNGKIISQSSKGDIITRSPDQMGFRRAVGYKVLGERLIGLILLTERIRTIVGIMKKKEIQWGVVVVAAGLWAKGICPTILAIWAGWLIGSGGLEML